MGGVGEMHRILRARLCGMRLEDALDSWSIDLRSRNCRDRTMVEPSLPVVRGVFS